MVVDPTFEAHHEDVYRGLAFDTDKMHLIMASAWMTRDADGRSVASALVFLARYALLGRISSFLTDQWHPAISPIERLD